jgi:hypothetical protein
MMCAATVNWTLFTDITSPAHYVMLKSTISYTFFALGASAAMSKEGLEKAKQRKLPKF